MAYRRGLPVPCSHDPQVLLAPGCVEGGGLPVLSFKQLFIYFKFSFPSCVCVGGLGFEFCVFVAGWRHALRSEWPFIIITITAMTVLFFY